MRKIFIFLIGFLILFGSWGAFVIYNNYFDNGALEDEIYAHLESVAQSKAERIGFFLDERKDDLVFLANSKEVIDLMNAKEITNPINDKLSFFQETNDYLDLILIDVGGKVLWSAKQEDIVGKNLEGDESTKLGEVYNKVKNDFGVGIFDPGYYGSDEKLSVFVTSPVLIDSVSVAGKKDMIGIIALQIDNSQVEERIVSAVDLGEIYLVNRDGIVTAGLEALDGHDSSKDDPGRPSGEPGVETIDTQMFKDCFKDYNNYYFERQGQSVDVVEKSGVYDNYNDERVFGAHQYILETGWCVMIEIKKGDIK